MFYLKYYKKYFFIVLAVLVILAGFTLWIYQPAHKDNTENTNKKIEKFTKKDEEISYQYLSKLALKTKDSFLSTYQLIQGRNGSDSESKAEMDGITMDLKLYSKKEQSVGKLLESEYNNQTKNLSEQSNIQNVKVYDVVKGSGCYIQQIDYEIKNDTTVYPCALYLKIDDVSEDAIYTFVSTVFENLDTISTSHAKGAECNVEFAASMTSVPYHPGAAKYFAEKGLDVATA